MNLTLQSICFRSLDLKDIWLACLPVRDVPNGHVQQRKGGKTSLIITLLGLQFYHFLSFISLGFS